MDITYPQRPLFSPGEKLTISLDQGEQTYEVGESPELISVGGCTRIYRLLLLDQAKEKRNVAVKVCPTSIALRAYRIYELLRHQSQDYSSPQNSPSDLLWQYYGVLPNEKGVVMPYGNENGRIVLSSPERNLSFPDDPERVVRDEIALRLGRREKNLRIRFAQVTNQFEFIQECFRIYYHFVLKGLELGGDCILFDAAFKMNTRVRPFIGDYENVHSTFSHVFTDFKSWLESCLDDAVNVARRFFISFLYFDDGYMNSRVKKEHQPVFQEALLQIEQERRDYLKRGLALNSADQQVIADRIKENLELPGTNRKDFTPDRSDTPAPNARQS